jgi:hypothetical protein
VKNELCGCRDEKQLVRFLEKQMGIFEKEVERFVVKSFLVWITCGEREFCILIKQVV